MRYNIANKATELKQKYNALGYFNRQDQRGKRGMRLQPINFPPQ